MNKNSLLIAACLTLLNLSTFSQALPNYLPSAGLIGWWPFDGNPNDISVNGHNGTVDGAELTEDRFANSGNAYLFSGGADHIRIPHINELNLSNNFTINCWVMPTGFNTFNCFISKASSGNSQVPGWLWGYSNFSYPPRLHFQGYPNFNGVSVSSLGGFLQENSWKNLTVSYDGQTSVLKYYVNAFLVDSIVVEYAFENSNLDVFFGNHFQDGNPSLNSDFNSAFVGKLDDIGMWDRVLSAQEIKGLFTGSTENTSPSFNLTINSTQETICAEQTSELTAVLNSENDDIYNWAYNLSNNGWSFVNSYNEHYYFKYQNALQQPEAKLLCEQNGGYLFCINEEQENAIVSAPLAYSVSYGDFWLGGFQDETDSNYVEPDGGWKWMDGTPIEFTVWGTLENGWVTNEPNNSDGGNFLMMDYSNMGQLWNDIGLAGGTPLLEFIGRPFYLWSTGETTPTITVSPAVTTTYTVTVFANGISIIDSVTIFVTSVDSIQLSSNSPLTAGETLELSANASAGTAFEWSGPNGFTSNLANPFITNAGVVNSGQYTLLPSAEGCTGEPQTIDVIVLPEDCAAFPQNLQNGLIGYWPFCGNANDESGNGHNGTPYDNPQLTSDRFGVPYSAYNFDGINDAIEIPASNPLFPTNISLSFWVRARAEGVALGGHAIRARFYGYIVFCDPTQQTLNFQLLHSPNEAQWTISSVSTSEWDTNWHHVVGTFDGAFNKLYVDGVLANEISSEVPTIIYGSDGMVVFGRDGNTANAPGGSSHFTGQLDDIIMYNRALTPTEITQLYTGDAEPTTARNEELKQLSIYPNPATETIMIQDANPGVLSVMDASGRLVKQMQVQGNAQISVADLDAGVYLLQHASKSETKMVKLIVE